MMTRISPTQDAQSIAGSSRNGSQSEEMVVAGLGEVKVSGNASVVLACLGLGSCVGISAYDPVARVGGMAHVVLPASDGKEEESPKYADVAVPLLMRKMRGLGAQQSRMIIKIAGGAQMSKAPGIDAAFKIGERNIQAVRSALALEGVTLAAADTGGNSGRTFRTHLESGKTTVSQAGSNPREL